MRLSELLLVVVYTAVTMAKKRHGIRRSSSEESIENLLYYKDCKHNKEGPSTEPPQPQTTEKPSDCPCPRMCCSMCCDCSIPLPQSPTAFPGRMMQPLQMQGPSPPMSMLQSPRRPPPFMPETMKNEDFMMGGMAKRKQGEDFAVPQPQPTKRKKFQIRPKITEETEPVLLQDTRREENTRRGLTLTRENIKSLISKDEDIKKILKDLVRVTMNKVDMKKHFEAVHKIQLKQGEDKGSEETKDHERPKIRVKHSKHKKAKETEEDENAEE